MANYKKHSAKQKAKIALEALKENKTLSELSSQYGVASSQISTWKQHLLQGAEELFTHSSKQQQLAQAQQDKEVLLYQQIGQLQMELEWLKKKLK
jgi:transposase-like protein